MSYISNVMTNPAYLICDVSIEQNYRDIWAYLQAKFTSGGLVQLADAGQYNPVATAYARSNSVWPGAQANNPNAAFDGTTTNGGGFHSNVVPTPGAPVYLYLDMGAPLGVANTFNPLSMRVFTYANVYDPKTVTVDVSDSWTIDPNSGAITATWVAVQASGGGSIPAQSASNVGFQNLISPGAHRFFRFGFTDTQVNTATYIQVPEIELYTAVAGGGTKLTTLVTSGPGTALNTQTANFQLWEKNDWGRANGSRAILKLWVGSGTVAGAPGVWQQGGTATDNAGNFSGASQTGAVISAKSAASNLNTYYRTMFNANNVATSAALSDGRMTMGLFYNLASAPIALVLERNHNADGTDDFSNATGAFYYGGFDSTGTQLVQPIPKIGVVPPVQSSGMFLVSDGTSSSVRGANFSVAPNFPFLGPMQLPMLGLAAHWAGEATMESLITDTLYGATHSYFPLGNNLTSVARGGIANSRLALRCE